MFEEDSLGRVSNAMNYMVLSAVRCTHASNLTQDTCVVDVMNQTDLRVQFGTAQNGQLA